MLSLYLVRHGQTDYSLHNRFCGSIDPPLNDTGVAMAEALAARYGDGPNGRGWTAIWSSPRLRAQQTAEPTARRANIGLTIDDDLREIAYGEWEGQPEAEVARADPARFHAWAAHPGRVAPPGGESGEAIAVRALAAVTRLRERHPDGNVLLVSHKATLRVLMCALLGLDVDLFRVRIAQPVCAISIIDFKPSGPLLQLLGDSSHLPPTLRAGDGT
jgi:probable phosphoglycerate mutase